MKLLRKIQYNSPVVLTFALISVAALFLNYVTKGAANRMFFSVYRSSPLSFGYWIRLFGHVFGHASLEHLSGNMLLFLVLGPMLEEKYGSKNLIMMIAIVAVVTGLLNNLLFSTGLLGASGIVFMAIILASVAGVGMEKGRIPLTLIVVAALYIGQEVAAGLFSQDNISHLTHIVGGLCGGAFGLARNRWMGRR